jgi:hypothetical protein
LWEKFKTHKLGVTINNFEKKHKEATDTPFKKLKGGWKNWKALIVTGLYTIKQRLKT